MTLMTDMLFMNLVTAELEPSGGLKFVLPTHDNAKNKISAL